MPMTREQQLIRIKDDYRAAHDNASASLRTMLTWAVETDRYELDMAKAMARAVDEFAHALAGETAPDSQGNPIRVNLAYLEPDQGWLWDQRDTISHPHMELNVQHGWRMCYSDVKANVLSVNDYNECHPDRPRIQFSLDFAGALADDGITVPSSIAPAPQVVQPELVPQAPSRRRERVRPAYRPSTRAVPLLGSSPIARPEGESLGPRPSPPA